MALAALVLTVLTFGPGLDGLLCKDEGSLSAAAAEQPLAAAVADLPHPEAPGDGVGICVHGHCHHAAPYVPISPDAAESPEDLTSATHPLLRRRVDTSDPKFGLIRPPRT
jgi:hypothetical protein